MLISLSNDDFQINKCTIILRTDEKICYAAYHAYALSILNITYLPYAIINALSFLNYFFFQNP